MTDRDRFLPDIKVAEPADQAETVQLARALFEPADQQHLLVEMQHLLFARVVELVLVELLLQRMEYEVRIIHGGQILGLGGGLLRSGFLGQW